MAENGKNTDIDNASDSDDLLKDLPQNNKADYHQVTRMIYLITQLGITMLTTIFLCIIIGALLEHFLQIHVMLWFIILGVVSGFKACWILIQKFLGNKGK